MAEADHGDCFMMALVGADVLEARAPHPRIKSSLRVVHGRPLYQGEGEHEDPDEHYFHAWVEFEAPYPEGSDNWEYMVFDCSNGKNLTMLRSDYYTLGHIDPEVYEHRVYTIGKAHKKVDRYQHSGPWDADNPPLTKEEAAAKRAATGVQ